MSCSSATLAPFSSSPDKEPSVVFLCHAYLKSLALMAIWYPQRVTLWLWNLIHSNMEVLAEELDLSSPGMSMSDRTWILLVYL